MLEEEKNGFALLTMLQISDTAFPTGGFSHSLGFESAQRHKMIRNKESYEKYIIASLENTASQSLPLVRDAFYGCGNMTELLKLDAICQTCLNNHVMNRASVRQGHSIMDTAFRTFTDRPGVARLHEALVKGVIEHGHLAVMFGALCGILHVALHDTLSMFMFTSLKAIIASSVRLGATGTLEAQGVQYQMQKLIPNIISRNLHISADAIRQCFPLVDIVQNMHDTMFSKMFYS